MFSLIRSCGCGMRRSSGRRLGLKGSSPSYPDPLSRTTKTAASSGHISLPTNSVEPSRAYARKVRRSGPLLLSGADRSNSGAEFREQLVEGARGLPAAVLAHGERLVRLAVAVDDRVGDLLKLCVANPLAERLVALVDVDAEALRLHPLAQRADRVAVRLADRDQPQLHGGEPEGEGAGVVLRQDADEALERAEERAVDH